VVKKRRNREELSSPSSSVVVRKPFPLHQVQKSSSLLAKFIKLTSKRRVDRYSPHRVVSRYGSRCKVMWLADVFGLSTYGRNGFESIAYLDVLFNESAGSERTQQRLSATKVT